MEVLESLEKLLRGGFGSRAVIAICGIITVFGAREKIVF